MVPKPLPLTQVSTERWDAFVSQSPYGHLLQSSTWARLKEFFGWEAARIAIERGGSIVAGAQVLFRPLLPRAPFPTIAYLPKGPVISPEDEDIIVLLWQAIHREARARKAFFLKAEPDWPWSRELEARFGKWGFRPGGTIQPQSTIIVDLTASHEEILARMKQKTRYNIRLASRKGVKVREGTGADLATFYELMLTTSRRDRFAIHSRRYYETVYRLFSPQGNAVLLLAEYEGEVLAGLMAFAWGRKAWYMYGASSDRHRNLMPNHLLQWEAMRWAKGKGCATYDLWGIPDEVGRDPQRFRRTVTDRRGGLWGVYRFKQGFGGEVVRWIGAWDYVYSPVWYRVYKLALTVYRRAM